MLLTDTGRSAVRAVHMAYIIAGADIITANTFRTNLRTLKAAGMSEREAAVLVRTAVGLAKGALQDAGRVGVSIAASVAPVEDCYQPTLVPSNHSLQSEHAWHADALAASGVDLALIETMNTIREAVIAVRCARAAAMPAWASFVCRSGGNLLSGERIADAAAAVTEAGASAVLVNCSNTTDTQAALEQLSATALVCGAYPNIEERDPRDDGIHKDHYFPPSVDVASLSVVTAEWMHTFDITIIGGCCGATPDHIAALAELVTENQAQDAVRYGKSHDS